MFEFGSQIRNYHCDVFGRMLFETDQDGRLIIYYIYKGRNLTAQNTAKGELYFYHFDKTGNTLALTNERAEIAAAYAYGPFGSLVNKSGNLDTSFTYIGEFGVVEDGDGLYFMKRRYYLSSIGRFVQKDPIGFAGGMNLYQYVGNNPISNIDPEGLSEGYTAEQLEQLQHPQWSFWRDICNLGFAVGHFVMSLKNGLFAMGMRETFIKAPLLPRAIVWAIPRAAPYVNPYAAPIAGLFAAYEIWKGMKGAFKYLREEPPRGEDVPGLGLPLSITLDPYLTIYDRLHCGRPAPQR